GRVGAVIAGRRSFDITGGWRGDHPLGAPVFGGTPSVPDGWPRAGGGRDVAAPRAGVRGDAERALRLAARGRADRLRHRRDRQRAPAGEGGRRRADDRRDELEPGATVSQRRAARPGPRGGGPGAARGG